MKTTIYDRFVNNLNEIDLIFRTSQTLREIYITSLKSIKTNKLSYEEKQFVRNSLQGLTVIKKDSIAMSEKENWSKLYSQAIILIV